MYKELLSRIHFHTSRERHSLRWWLSDLQCRREISGEFSLFSSLCGVGIDIGNDEHAIGVNVCIPYVLSTFVNVHAPQLYKWASAASKLWPTHPREGKYITRATELRVHNWAIWWKLWAPEGEWHSGCPKYRDGSFHPLGHMQRQSEEVIKVEPVEVPMPERTYHGVGILTKTTWGWTKLPRIFDREDLIVEIKMNEGEQVPHPGKGENSWDCDQDATYSSTGPARSIEEAIGSFVGSSLRSRRRHGGRNWRPEVKPPVEPSPASAPAPASA